MLIPYGFDRLPRDWGLRCVEVGNEPLLLNSEPVPADAMPLTIGDHAARVAAATAWLESQCGDYAPLRRQFIAVYFRFVASQIEMHRAELTEQLKPYDGLYAREDFTWSALRPLPRAWVPAGGRLLPADIVFWDGTNTVALELAARETEKQKALMATGIAVYRVGPNAFDRLQEILPEPFKAFWRGQTLPSSPFRRAMPRLV